MWLVRSSSLSVSRSSCSSSSTSARLVGSGLSVAPQHRGSSAPRAETHGFWEASPTEEEGLRRSDVHEGPHCHHLSSHRFAKSLSVRPLNTAGQPRAQRRRGAHRRLRRLRGLQGGGLQLPHGRQEARDATRLQAAQGNGHDGTLKVSLLAAARGYGRPPLQRPTDRLTAAPRARRELSPLGCRRRGLEAP